MNAGLPGWLDRALRLTRDMLAATAAGDLGAIAALEEGRRAAMERAGPVSGGDASRLRELHDLNDSLIESLSALRRELCGRWDTTRRARAALSSYGRVARDG